MEEAVVTTWDAQARLRRGEDSVEARLAVAVWMIENYQIEIRSLERDYGFKLPEGFCRGRLFCEFEEVLGVKL